MKLATVAFAILLSINSNASLEAVPNELSTLLPPAGQEFLIQGRTDSGIGCGLYFNNNSSGNSVELMAHIANGFGEGSAFVVNKFTAKVVVESNKEVVQFRSYHPANPQIDARLKLKKNQDGRITRAIIDSSEGKKACNF